MLAADTETITRAHRLRKMWGGGMRQAGILAAAGIVSLTEMVDRLPEDHANARAFARGLAEIPEIPPEVRAEANALSPEALRAGLDAETLARIDEILEP